MIHLKQADFFLRALCGDEFVFQTFTDNKAARKKRKFDPLAKVFTGTFDQHRRKLSALSDQGAGIFVQINEGSKRGKDHITKIRAVWVDLDDPETSQESLASMRQYMPKPAIITQSSKGKYHIYWRVTDCELDQFSKFQQSLAIKFYSDMGVKNLDRVMRLPGFPHQKGIPQDVTCICIGGTTELKVLHAAAAKAPTIIPAAVDEPTTERVTDVFGLDMGGDYIAPVALKPGNRTTKLVAHVGYLVSQGYSEEAVRAEIKQMNLDLSGDYPLHPNELNQEVLGAISRFMDKHKKECEIIDAEWQHTKAKCKERKAKAREELKVQKAAVKAPNMPVLVPEDTSLTQEDQSLDQWLARFLYVERGSRVIDTAKEGEHAEYTLDEFKKKTANIFVGAKAKLANKWFECRGRQDVRDTIYNPTKEKIVTLRGERFWNIYSPSEILPAAEVDSCRVAEFMQHMEFFFPVKGHREIFLNWFAMTVTEPKIRILWAPLIISPQGAGKGLIYYVLKQLLGTHNCKMILADRLENQFNSFLFNSTLVCIDEMRESSRFNISDKLKSFITEEELERNSKHVTEGMQEVFANILIFTNHSNATYIEDKDRRFWVYRVVAIKPAAYYHSLWDWARDKENLSHLMKWCLERDLSKFNFAEAPPATSAKLEMIQANKSDIEHGLADAIEHREGIFGADVVGYTSIKEYVSLEYNAIMTPKIEGVFRQVVGRVTKQLPQCVNAQKPMIAGIKARQRLRCVRNFDFWSTRSLEDLRYEFARSIQMGMSNGAGVLPPKMEEVKVTKSKSK